MTKMMLVAKANMENRLKTYTIEARFARDEINFETLGWPGEIESYRATDGKNYPHNVMGSGQFVYQGPSRDQALKAYRKLIAAKKRDGYKVTSDTVFKPE
jgi:hypothetical protein